MERAAAVTGSYAIVQFIDPAPGLWKVGIANALIALSLAAIPLLHRFGPMAAPLAFAVGTYVAIFIICSLLGTGTGMQMYYLVGVALVILFFGLDRIVLASAFCLVAAALVVALEVLVPENTGLQPAATQFGSFVGTVGASCAILFTIVFYAMREVARTEATAEREYARSESLLANILPAAVAGRLKSRTEPVIADRYLEASILFADMAGFTARASDTDPGDLVQFLNRVFTDFDRLVEAHGLEKIKTTGDSYMVVSGVPVPRPDHAQALAELALDMREAAADLRDPLGRSVPIRIGIAGGPVVAGVVGTRKFFYDVWGDAVNVASRMESTGLAGRIQVSRDVYERLKDEFVLEERGAIEVKGKGSMQTWFLVGRRASEPAAQTISGASAARTECSHEMPLDARSGQAAGGQ
jgi:adenylate cyclase